MSVPDLPATVQVQVLLPEEVLVWSGWRIDVSTDVNVPMISPEATHCSVIPELLLDPFCTTLVVVLLTRVAVPVAGKGCE
jgi:hypothetical protein